MLIPSSCCKHFVSSLLEPDRRKAGETKRALDQTSGGLSSPHSAGQSVQSLSRVQLSATPWTAERQASLSITNSWSLLRLKSMELGMPSNHLTLCRPLLLPPSIFPSIKVFSSESVLCFRWPRHCTLQVSRSIWGKSHSPSRPPFSPLGEERRWEA